MKITGAEWIRGAGLGQGKVLAPFFLEGFRLTHGFRNLEGPSEGSITLGTGAEERIVWDSDRGKLVLTSGGTADSGAGDSKLSSPLTPNGGTPGTVCKTVAG